MAYVHYYTLFNGCFTGDFPLFFQWLVCERVNNFGIIVLQHIMGTANSKLNFEYGIYYVLSKTEKGFRVWFLFLCLEQHLVDTWKLAYYIRFSSILVHYWSRGGDEANKHQVFHSQRKMPQIYPGPCILTNSSFQIGAGLVMIIK